MNIKHIQQPLIEYDTNVKDIVQTEKNSYLFLINK